MSKIHLFRQGRRIVTLLAMPSVGSFHSIGTFSISDVLYWLGGGGREGSGVQTWPKKPKMALITEYLPAAASADATADATCRINIS